MWSVSVLKTSFPLLKSSLSLTHSLTTHSPRSRWFLPGQNYIKYSYLSHPSWLPFTQCNPRHKLGIYLHPYTLCPIMIVLLWDILCLFMIFAYKTHLTIVLGIIPYHTSMRVYVGDFKLPDVLMWSTLFTCIIPLLQEAKLHLCTLDFIFWLKITYNSFRICMFLTLVCITYCILCVMKSGMFMCFTEGRTSLQYLFSIFLITFQNLDEVKIHIWTQIKCQVFACNCIPWLLGKTRIIKHHVELANQKPYLSVCVT